MNLKALTLAALAAAATAAASSATPAQATPSHHCPAVSTGALNGAPPLLASKSTSCGFAENIYDAYVASTACWHHRTCEEWVTSPATHRRYYVVCTAQGHGPIASSVVLCAAPSSVGDPWVRFPNVEDQ